MSPRRAVTAVVTLLAVAVAVALALAVVGSSPTLLAKVPAGYQGAVAAFGDGAARLSGSARGALGLDDDNATTGGPRTGPDTNTGTGTDTGPDTGSPGPDRPDPDHPGRDTPGSDTAAANGVFTSPDGMLLPLHGEWAPRRPGDVAPPAGLVAGLDYTVETTDEGYLAHWPCGHEIPVHTYDAPLGTEGDLIWAVDTLAAASGLPLRYAGPGTEAQRDAEGTISVHHGDHPMFSNPEVAGVGGVETWSHGLVSRGSVTLKPGQITAFPGDPWSRVLTLHELMHAVGVGHAAEHRPEIMTTRRALGHQAELGPGDRFALSLVGCR